MIKEKFSQLVSPVAIKKIARKVSATPSFKTARIKVIKSYLDKRSYSLVALYDFDGFKIIGVANSDNNKEYSWRVSRSIYPLLKGKFSFPRPLGYNKEFGIFFREYKKGKALSGRDPRGAASVKGFLDFLQTIKPQGIKKGIFLQDFEKNLRILEKRKKNILKKPYFLLKGNINKYSLEGNCFVHGDFQPSNVFSDKDSLFLIDAEKCHWGAREEDAACLMAHLRHTFNINDKLVKKWQALIYKGCDSDKIKVFEKYFGLLIASHVMIWNNYQKGLKIFKKL